MSDRITRAQIDERCANVNRRLPTERRAPENSSLPRAHARTTNPPPCYIRSNLLEGSFGE